MIFRLYDVPTGGVYLWEEQWTGSNGVQVSDGLFNVMLGSLTSIPQSVITEHDSLFLGITVGTDDEMAPRVQLGSVPFAVQALTVPDGSVTTEKIADEAVTQAKLGADVSLEPPDGSITTEKLADDAVTKDKIAHQFGASNSEMLNFVPRDPTGWDYDSDAEGTTDIDISSIVPSTAVGVKVVVSFSTIAGRYFELYAKGKTSAWDKMRWYSWNDAENLAGRQRTFTHDFFFATERKLTVVKSSGYDAGGGGNDAACRVAVLGWWEPAHQ